MKGAKKIFIHGEEIARAKDVAQGEQDILNILFQEDANIRNELNQRIDDMPVFSPQDLVDNGFDYSYEDTTQLSSVVVEVLPYGSGEGFTLQDDDWYYADNVGVDQSYAMAKIIFHNESDTEQTACIEVQQVAEQGCDYFVTSLLNTDLDDDINDSMNVDWTFNEEGNMQRNLLYNVPVGDSYTIIKYRKDGSVNAEEELARFKASAAYLIITETKHLATTEDVEEQINEAVANIGGSDILSITGNPYSSGSGDEGFTFTGDALLAIANKVQTSGGQQVSLNIIDTSRGRQYKVLGNAGMAINGVNIELTLEFTIILSGMKFYHYGSCTFPSDNTAVLNCISDDYNG